MPSDELLTRLAQEEILAATKRGAARAEVAGPSGWLRPKLHSTNKTFLQNTIRGALVANDLKDQKNLQVKKNLKAKLKYHPRFLKATSKSQSEDEVVVLKEISKEKKDRTRKSVRKDSNQSVEWSGTRLEIRPLLSKRPTKRKLPKRIEFVKDKRSNSRS